MQFSKLFDDDRAVSPVIGVILMVAITVILAAVIGTFVLGLGDQVQSTTPQAQFGFEISSTDADGDPSGVSITHESGDSINADVLSVAVSGQNFDGGTGDSSSDLWSDIEGGDGTVTAGDTATITANGATTGDDDFAGDPIRVIYNNPDSDQSSTIAKQEY